MVNFTFFVPHIKIHISTKFQVSRSKNAFRIAKTKFPKNFGQKNASEAFLPLLALFFERFSKFLFLMIDMGQMHLILKNQPSSPFRGWDMMGGPNRPPPMPHTTTEGLVGKGLTSHRLDVQFQSLFLDNFKHSHTFASILFLKCNLI